MPIRIYSPKEGCRAGRGEARNARGEEGCGADGDLRGFRLDGVPHVARKRRWLGGSRYANSGQRWLGEVWCVVRGGRWLGEVWKYGIVGEIASCGAAQKALKNLLVGNGR